MNFEKTIQEAVSVLKQGGTILYPTDTIWGLGCDATNPLAVSKIYNLKKRDDSKALIVLVATERDVLQYTASVDLGIFDFLAATDKPTTVIYEHGLGFADNLLAGDGSIAIRICNNDFCKALIKRFGKPIVSTSANTSGMAAPQTFKEITAEIKAGVDYVVAYNQHNEIPAKASSIIKWNNGKVEYIRK